MLGAGLPEPMARMFASFDDNTARGGLAGVTSDFETLTSRKPGQFADWLKLKAAAFAG